MSRIRLSSFVFWLSALCLLSSFVLVGVAQPPASTPAFSTEQLDFFETNVRPVLVSKCIECHGPDTQESELRIDSREAIIKGSTSGSIVDLKAPEKSLLLQVLSHQQDIQMPPDDKLADKEIAAIKAWIELRLPWPPGDQGKITKYDSYDTMRREHWAFQPIEPVQLPAVNDITWARSPLDTLVLAKLESAEITPSPEADRRTLIRRVYFNLLGIPPTPQQAQSFVDNPEPDAYERLVDQVLSAPQFGERWGRHWLDVARYSDTLGYNFQRERRFPFSYTYRDYVVRAFNQDIPYDDFIRHQLAADLMTLEDQRDLAGMGLLTVGRQYRREQLDTDDRIDTVTRGFMGLTVACARCHDHKYDAIPTEDYYSLYGVFASARVPAELPTIQTPEETIGYTQFAEGLAVVQGELDEYDTKRAGEFTELFRDKVFDYFVRAAGRPDETQIKSIEALSVRDTDIRNAQVTQWQSYVLKTVANDDPFFSLLKILGATQADKFVEVESAAREKLMTLEEGIEGGQVNPLLKRAYLENPPKSVLELSIIYANILQDVRNETKKLGTQLTPAQQQVYQHLISENSPTNVTLENVNQFYNRADGNTRNGLVRKIDLYKSTTPGNPPRAMVMEEKPNPYNPVVFIRGNSGRRGEPVKRQFLYALDGDQQEPFKNGGGRLELAEKIAHPDNPLTRRVLINRIWSHHFGKSLVTSPSDFGIRCDKPIQLDLMDYLANVLLENDWSIKEVHREILLSATFRQASVDRPQARSVDPENALFWRKNRQRLEYEAFRDSVMYVTNELDFRMGGLSEDLTNSPTNHRRAIYSFIDRQDLAGLLRVFDFPNPDSHSAQRPVTTVPQQALFIMNSPVILERAKRFVLSSEFQTTAESERLSYLYQRFFQRSPSSTEEKVAQQFFAGWIESSEASKMDAWQQYAHLLLMTNEFMFVD